MSTPRRSVRLASVTNPMVLVVYRDPNDDSRVHMGELPQSSWEKISWFVKYAGTNGVMNDEDAEQFCTSLRESDGFKSLSDPVVQVSMMYAQTIVFA